MTDNKVVIHGSGPAIRLAESLRAMVETFQTIVVGRVTGIKEQRHPDRPLPVDPGTPNKGIPETVFAFEVVDVVYAARITAGDTIGVVQMGGAGEDGLFYEMDSDPLLDVGVTYLLFLRDNQPLNGRDEFVSAVFGRFIINEKDLLNSMGGTVSMVSVLSPG